ncbi:MAG: 30S ribosomal protein S16 [bacterium]|nr:30S ribosomal protein S16 [bacterium]MDZ4231492.1 30S ribosomal protein S16 [Patescibacteria group bacterium]
MLAIKLKLIGKKGQHSFRVIVQEKRSKLQGKFTDDLGWFNPHTNQFKINDERLKHWLQNGAQPTESVQKILKSATGISEVQEHKGRTRPKKKKKEKLSEKDSPATEAAVPAENEAAAPEAPGEQPPDESAPAQEPQEEPQAGKEE